MIPQYLRQKSDFDKVWDSGIEEYLGAGGQAIMDERAAKWKQPSEVPICYLN